MSFIINTYMFRSHSATIRRLCSIMFEVKQENLCIAKTIQTSALLWTYKQHNGIFHDITILFILYHAWTKNFKFYNIFSMYWRFGGFSPFTSLSVALQTLYCTRQKYAGVDNKRHVKSFKCIYLFSHMNESILCPFF